MLRTKESKGVLFAKLPGPFCTADGTALRRAYALINMDTLRNICVTSIRSHMWEMLKRDRIHCVVQLEGTL